MTGTGRSALVKDWREKAAKARAAADSINGSGVYHERLKSAHHFSAATWEACANDLEALSSSASSTSDRSEYRAYVEANRSLIESPEEIARVRESAERMEAWNVIRLLDSHEALRAEFASSASSETPLPVDVALDNLRSLVRTEAGHIAYFDDMLEELILAVRADAASSLTPSQQPEKTADDAPVELCGDSREAWAMGYNAAMGEVYGSSAPNQNGVSYVEDGRLVGVIGTFRPRETQEERPDNRDLALAIIKQCAAYVRGFDGSPPDVGYCGRDWLQVNLRQCADLMEAQPNAIINSAAQSSPVPHEAKKDN